MKPVSRRWLALAWVFGCLLAASAWAAEPAADFKVASRDGHIQLQQYQGRVLLLDFWASWCGPCRQSFPWMQEMHTTYSAQGLAILAINLDTDRALADQFLEQHTATFDIGFDPEGKVAEQWQLPGMPTSFLIGPDGQILQRHVGFKAKKKADYEAQIQQALQALPQQSGSPAAAAQPAP
jgi:peroxiredoxin